MFRIALIFALTFSQLIPLGTGALYLCIGDNGSICFNSNPETCTCCENCSEPESKDGNDECCCSCGHSHASDVKVAIAVADCDDCQCTHLLLPSGQSMPVVLDSDHVRQLSSFDWLSCPPAVSLDSILAVERQLAPVKLGEPASYALLTLSCVVLRC